jgi:transcriptional regulator with XRE-family HTH domain
MTTNVRDIVAALTPAQRKKVNRRAAELIAEEMTLRELRRARRLTQSRIAKALGISQDGVSRLENRTDFLISTLRKTVQAMGGRVSVVISFPDGPAVELAGLGDEKPLRKRSKARLAK